MPEIPQKKVGIIACSGEEIAEGTVTRLAALKVLHEMRRGDTVTLCLPLFLAGGEGERTFARFYPTITVDGCRLRCAARATERYSAQPAESIVITEVAAERGIEGIANRRNLNESGRRAVDATAEIIAGFVDRLLEKKDLDQERDGESAQVGAQTTPGTCSCGSGIQVSNLEIDGKLTKVIALPILMEQFNLEGRPADQAVAIDLLAQARVYNKVPLESEPGWLAAIQQEYASYCCAKRGKS